MTITGAFLFISQILTGCSLERNRQALLEGILYPNHMALGKRGFEPQKVTPNAPEGSQQVDPLGPCVIS